jgi:hypothetical protein
MPVSPRDVWPLWEPGYWVLQGIVVITSTKPAAPAVRLLEMPGAKMRYEPRLCALPDGPRNRCGSPGGLKAQRAEEGQAAAILG